MDPLAYVQAASTFGKGDVAIIFTPDDTHFDIAKCCAERGMHVLVTKPIVKTLEDHLELSRLSTLHSSLIGVEVRACEQVGECQTGANVATSYCTLFTDLSTPFLLIIVPQSLGPQALRPPLQRRQGPSPASRSPPVHVRLHVPAQSTALHLQSLGR